jgi:vacuolar-type H+-ATPase subunit E/Vma4
MLTDAIKEFPSDEVVVKIGKDASGRLDMSKLRTEIARVAPRVKIDWHAENNVDVDGVVVEARDGGIRAVNNVAGRFERLDREILVEIRRRLFAE